VKKKSESLVLAGMLRKLAPKIGARVLLEPEWKIAGQITFRSGRKSYFRYNTLDLNPVGASDIAKDKDYANFFMRKLGYPTVPGKTFFSDEWCKAIGSKRDIKAAYMYAKKFGFPLIVKPNSGTQGTDVALVYTKAEFFRAMKQIFKHDRVALVQKYVRGRDYRIVVLDKEIISAYERVPLSVIGNGRSTIRQLINKKQREFDISNRDTRIDLKDSRIVSKLRQQKLSFASVPKNGEQVFLLDNANLSTGGDAVDVTGKLHPQFKKLAISLTRDMGLRLCGVDLMVDGDITEPPRTYHILEINAAPGLDHYVKQGKAQQKIVEILYLKVLKHLAK
jgi:D-alanine-D-alanine ligase-like ATP-grasp enzyme